MAGRVHGNLPRPWALAYGVDRDDEFTEALRALFPTVKFLGLDEQVRFVEWDAVISVGRPPTGVADRSHVVQFGGIPFTGSYPWELRAADGSHASLFQTPESNDARLAELAALTLPPEPGSDYQVLNWHKTFATDIAEPPLVAFCSELAGGPLAGRVQREGAEGAELWWLPTHTTRRGEWVAVALRRWQREYPDTFPASAEWRSSPEWSTRAVTAARTALEAHRAEAVATLTRFQVEQAAYAAALDAASASADAAEWRLLTAQGGDLVKEVIAALSDLGFAARDADNLPEHATAKQEDLRVTEEGWTALAEVKGYEKRGARAGDLLQLGKAVENYIMREGKLPDARWYVVNQMFGTSPGNRPRPLAGSPDVGPFASQGGLVIDTRDLFRLREAVRREELDAESARALLRSSTGVFEYPAPVAHR